MLRELQPAQSQAFMVSFIINLIRNKAYSRPYIQELRQKIKCKNVPPIAFFVWSSFQVWLSRAQNIPYGGWAWKKHGWCQCAHGAAWSPTWNTRPSMGLPFTARIMSPAAMAPFSSAGCPGKSLLILTRSFLRWLQLSLSICTKLNPNPLAFFFRVTSNLGPVLWDMDKINPLVDSHWSWLGCIMMYTVKWMSYFCFTQKDFILLIFMIESIILIIDQCCLMEI